MAMRHDEIYELAKVALGEMPMTAFRFILSYIHRHGFAWGIKSERAEETMMAVANYRYDFSQETWKYYLGDGVLKLYIVTRRNLPIIDMTEEVQLLSRSEVDVVRHYLRLEGQWAYGMESIWMASLKPIDDIVMKLLPGIIPTESIRNCENIRCINNNQVDNVEWFCDQWWCKKCISSYSLPQPSFVESNESRDEHRAERAKVTKLLRLQILERDGFACRACGRNPRDNPGVILHVDHIRPIARGGKSIPENLQVLCMDCNLAKSDKEYTQMSLWDVATV